MGRFQEHRAGKSRDHFQQLSSSHNRRKKGFLSNGKHDEIDIFFFGDP